MARARNIKPGFFQNDDLSELPPIARLLFIGMWTIADYKGCLEYRPKRIKAQILPYDDCDVAKLANNLDKSGFISIYSVQGQQYIKIVNFEKHQNPHKNERETGSDIPDIDKKDCKIKDLEDIENNRDKNGTDRADSLLLIPDSLNPLTDSLIPESTKDQNLAPAKADADKKNSEPKEAPNPLNLETWQSYKHAYSNRYGVDPVRDAATNAKIKAIVKALGGEAPSVAAFFVSHNGSRYVGNMHQIGLLSMDYAKLRTEWATNSRMTQTKALQADKTQTNYDAWAPLIAEAEERERREANGN